MYAPMEVVLRLPSGLQPLKRRQSHLGSNDGSTRTWAWADSEMRPSSFDWSRTSGALFFGTLPALFQLHRQGMAFLD